MDASSIGIYVIQLSCDFGPLANGFKGSFDVLIPSAEAGRTVIGVIALLGHTYVQTCRAFVRFIGTLGSVATPRESSQDCDASH